MKDPEAGLSRREFLRNSAGYAAVTSLGSMREASRQNTTLSAVRIPPDAPLPILTAAAEISKKKGVPVLKAVVGQPVGNGEVVLAVGPDARNHVPRSPRRAELGVLYSEIGRLLVFGQEWELVRRLPQGMLIAGATPRNVCRAALAWLENPSNEEDRLSVYQFDERFTMWDNALNQWYRFSKGFDREAHIRQVALTGHTGVEINRYADPGGYHVLHRKFPYDSYAWYMSYAPALDAFVESSLTRGIYPPAELAANLADIRQAADIARRYGLKPGFVCYEPRGVAEEIFERHPQLRGARTDHPGRSLQPRYSMDIANPRVLKHYAEMLTNLMKDLPDLRYFVFWTGDSGSGLPFASRLYPGPNGSYLARSKRLEDMAAGFAGALLEAGRRINPEFEVIMEIGWEYTTEERRKITATLPDGVTVSHVLGGRLLDGGDFGDRVGYIEDDRELGKEPYGAIVMSTMWDPEPIIGVPAPSPLLAKFANLRKLGIRKIMSQGGVLSPPQCPFSINQELHLELLRGEVVDPEAFYLRTARRWCEGSDTAASLLVQAWQKGDEALRNWPVLNWYHAGSGQTQGKWITRPLVPDISRLTEHERSAWERNLFTLPWDIGRPNIAFEGGIRMYREEQLEQAVSGYDQAMLPLLAETVALLERAWQGGRLAVIEDQRDRYQGFLLRERTVRNLFDAQVAINYYLLKVGNPAQQRQRLTAAIRAEMANTRDWIRLLRGSRTNPFRVTESQETPFLYKTPIEDLELKLGVMEMHLSDEPGPFLEELAAENSESELLFWNGCGDLEGTK